MMCVDVLLCTPRRLMGAGIGTEGHLSQRKDVRISPDTGVRRVLELAAIAAVALVPMILVAAASRHGPGASSDSVGYAVAAKSFATTGQFTYWDGTAYTIWPPGLALILSFFDRIGADLDVAVVVMNTLAAGAGVALTYLVGLTLTASRRGALAAASIVAVLSTTTDVYRMLWSEPIFCVLCLAALCLLARTSISRPGPISVVAIAVTISITCSVRYLGIALIPVAGASLLLATIDRGLAKAVAIGMVTSIASSAGLALVVARNLMLGSPAFGPRTGSHYSAVQAGSDVVATFGRYVWPTSGPRLAILLGVPVAVLIALGVVAVLLHTGRPRRAGIPVVLFTCAYLGLLVASEMSTAIEPISARYVLPIFGPAVVLAVVGGQWLLRSARELHWASARFGHGESLSRLAVVVLSAVFIGAGILFLVGNGRSIAHVVATSPENLGYNSAQVRDSELAAATGRLQGGVTSNDPIQVAWATDRVPVFGRLAIAQGGDLATELRKLVSSGALTYYAQFDDPMTVQGVTTDDLRGAGIVLREVAAYPDGILYVLALPTALQPPAATTP
jgi:hypothetical protein